MNEGTETNTAPVNKTPRPRWASVIGWTCIALAALVPLAIMAFLQWVLWGDQDSAVAWAVGLVAGSTVPLGAAFLTAGVLGEYGLYPPLIATWWLLLDGGICLLRRDHKAGVLLAAYGGIVTAANMPLSLFAVLTGGDFSPSLLIGTAWPLFVVCWMFRPSIWKEIASWKPAAPPESPNPGRAGAVE